MFTKTLRIESLGKNPYLHSVYYFEEFDSLTMIDYQSGQLKHLIDNSHSFGMMLSFHGDR